jgi:hypothetical protein
MVTSRHASSRVSMPRLPHFNMKWKMVSIHRRDCNYSFLVANSPMLAVVVRWFVAGTNIIFRNIGTAFRACDIASAIAYVMYVAD